MPRAALDSEQAPTASVRPAPLVLLGTSEVFADEDRVIEALKQAVGARSGSAGMVAIIIDQSGERLSSYGSSGREGVPMDGDAVFEIMSNTKVLTAKIAAWAVERTRAGPRRDSRTAT